MGSSPGSAVQRLDFSEALELLDFLSSSPPSDGVVLFKRVSSIGGNGSERRVSTTLRSVLDSVYALLCPRDTPFTKWAAHSTWVEARPIYSDSELSGKGGGAVGEVVVVILSTSKPRS